MITPEQVEKALRSWDSRALSGEGLTVEIEAADRAGFLEVTLRRGQVRELVDVLRRWLKGQP